MPKRQSVFKYWSYLFKYLSACSSGGARAINATFGVPPVPTHHFPCPPRAAAPGWTSTHWARGWNPPSKGQNFSLLIRWRANTCLPTTWFVFFFSLFFPLRKMNIYHYTCATEMYSDTCQLLFPGYWGGMSYWYYYWGIDVNVNVIFRGRFWILLALAYKLSYK